VRAVAVHTSGWLRPVSGVRKQVSDLLVTGLADVGFADEVVRTAVASQAVQRIWFVPVAGFTMRACEERAQYVFMAGSTGSGKKFFSVREIGNVSQILMAIRAGDFGSAVNAVLELSRINVKAAFRSAEEALIRMAGQTIIVRAESSFAVQQI